MYAETIICKLYEARTDLGLTQQQVADGADMNVRDRFKFCVNVKN